MFGLLASECGWDHNFILDNFTLSQVAEYYRLLSKKKLRDLQLSTISTLKAVGYAFGSIKKKDFMEFFNSLNAEEKTAHDSFEKMKEQGLNVEDR